MTLGRPVFCLALSIVLAFLFLPTLAQAQQAAATTGVIRGLVLDPEGQAVPGARVEVVNTETQFTRVVTSNEEGRFAAANLPVGLYDVNATSDQVIGDVRLGGILRCG